MGRAGARPVHTMSFKRIVIIALICVGVIVLVAVPPAIYIFMGYYDALEQEVVARFSGKRWDIPSRI